MGQGQSARGSSSGGGVETKKLAFSDSAMNVCGAPRRAAGGAHKTPTRQMSAGPQTQTMQRAGSSGLRPPMDAPPLGSTRQPTVRRQTSGAQFGNPNVMGARAGQHMHYNRDPFASAWATDSSSDSIGSNSQSPEPAQRSRAVAGSRAPPLAQSSLRMPAVARSGSIRSAGSASARSGVASPAPSVQSAKPQPSANGKYPKGTCDKCDGPHLTDLCPVYKKKRDDHPDAWRNFGRKTPLEMGKGGGNFKLKSAKVIRQPGDGSCLFHSMSYGIPGVSAGSLRREIAGFIKANPNLEIADTPMKDWVKWDSGCSVAEYANRMAVSGWGGGIEMAACSYCRKVNVHVYERGSFGSYKRISCFDVPGARGTVHVLYCGGVHYDALVP